MENDILTLLKKVFFYFENNFEHILQLFTCAKIKRLHIRKTIVIEFLTFY